MDVLKEARLFLEEPRWPSTHGECDSELLKSCGMIGGLADEIDRLRAELSDARAALNAATAAHADCIVERDEARRLIDEARTTFVGIAGATARAWELPRSEFIDEFLPWAQSRARDAVEKMKAAPVPAQPAERLSKEWYLRNAKQERDCCVDVGAGHATLPIPAGPTYDGPCMCARDHCQNRSSMPHPTWKCRKVTQPAVPDDVAKDAARYRWLLSGECYWIDIFAQPDGRSIYASSTTPRECMSEAIDAAILSAAENEGRKDEG